MRRNDLAPHELPSKFRIAHVPLRQVRTEIEERSPSPAQVRHAEPRQQLAARQWGGRKLERHAHDRGLVACVCDRLVKGNPAALVSHFRGLDGNHAEEELGLLARDQRQLGKVSLRVAPEEIKDARAAWIEPRRKRRPGHGRLRRVRRAERLERPRLRETREIRQMSLLGPLGKQVGVGAVKAEHHHLRRNGTSRPAAATDRRPRENHGRRERGESSNPRHPLISPQRHLPVLNFRLLDFRL